MITVHDWTAITDLTLSAVPWLLVAWVGVEVWAWWRRDRFFRRAP